MMKPGSEFVVGMVLMLGMSTIASAQTCRVSDPTGTPLNVRATPSGSIISTLGNGVFVNIELTQGRWIYIVHADDNSPIGWVFKDYVDCKPVHNLERHPDPGFHAPKTGWDENSGPWECAVVRVIPPDRDPNPGYKVLLNVYVSDLGRITSLDVKHVLADGQIRDRSEQYSNSTLSYDNNVIRWSGQRGKLVMTGTFAPYGKPSYVEVITRNGRGETRIETICHQTESN
jgi:Bacterial SH3 domain